MNGKRIARVIYMAVATLAVIIGLSCTTLSVDTYAASPKTQVKSAVKQLMKGIKNCSDKDINAVLRIKGQHNRFKNYKKNNPGRCIYVKKANKKLSYKITKVKVDGKKATVKVKIRYVDATETVKNAIKEFGAAEARGEIKIPSQEEMDEMDIYETWGLAMKVWAKLDECVGKAASYSSVKKMRTETVTLNMVKVGKRWKLDLLDSKMENIMFADYPRAEKAISEEETKRLRAEGAASVKTETPAETQEETP